ncbi:hypothetical protein SNEBB_006955 [Seison nebaliae]|nr:hypothetical protein SNEBB_006955 [Seison nebaliae]
MSMYMSAEDKRHPRLNSQVGNWENDLEKSSPTIKHRLSFFWNRIISANKEKKRTTSSFDLKGYARLKNPHQTLSSVSLKRKESLMVGRTNFLNFFEKNRKIQSFPSTSLETCAINSKMAPDVVRKYKMTCFQILKPLPKHEKAKKIRVRNPLYRMNDRKAERVGRKNKMKFSKKNRKVLHSVIKDLFYILQLIQRISPEISYSHYDTVGKKREDCHWSYDRNATGDQLESSVLDVVRSNKKTNSEGLISNQTIDGFNNWTETLGIKVDTITKMSDNFDLTLDDSNIVSMENSVRLTDFNEDELSNKNISRMNDDDGNSYTNDMTIFNNSMTPYCYEDFVSSLFTEHNFGNKSINFETLLENNERGLTLSTEVNEENLFSSTKLISIGSLKNSTEVIEDWQNYENVTRTKSLEMLRKRKMKFTAHSDTCLLTKNCQDMNFFRNKLNFVNRNKSCESIVINKKKINFGSLTKKYSVSKCLKKTGRSNRLNDRKNWIKNGNGYSIPMKSINSSSTINSHSKFCISLPNEYKSSNLFDANGNDCWNGYTTRKRQRILRKHNYGKRLAINFILAQKRYGEKKDNWFVPEIPFNEFQGENGRDIDLTSTVISPGEMENTIETFTFDESLRKLKKNSSEDQLRDMELFQFTSNIDSSQSIEEEDDETFSKLAMSSFQKSVGIQTGQSMSTKATQWEDLMIIET